MENLNSIPAEVRARIIEAANRLFEASGGLRHPTQAEVRRAAQADMNTTNLVMREWKRQQTAKPEPIAVAVPDQVQSAGTELLQVVWAAAQELGNASLKAAQESWAQERSEMESMRLELAQLYESQAEELEQAHEAKGLALREKEKADHEVARLSAGLGEATSRADQAETKVLEIERRVSDLKEELGRAHEDAAAVRTELKEARLSHLAEVERLQEVAAAQVEQARSELATFKGKAGAVEESLTKQVEQLQADILSYRDQLTAATAEGKSAAQDAARELARAKVMEVERDQAREDSALARENAARLGGQLEALQQQVAVLMDRFPVSKTAASKKPRQDG